MKNRYLTVYNTCGITQRSNDNYYIEAIKSLLNQETSHRIILSSCLNSEECRNLIQKTFGNNISYLFIDEKLTVNITFNKAILECVKYFGEFEGYTYVDSGVKLLDKIIYQEMANELSDTVGLVTTNASTDNGFVPWFGKELTERTVVPIGRAVHPHISIYHNDILKFYSKVFPDIFKSFCTESVLSFMLGAIKKQWVVRPDLMVQHWHSMDGASSGYLGDHQCVLNKQNDGKGVWNNIFDGDMKDIISNPKGYENGFGFEEIQSILIHKSECFDKNYFCTNEKLKYFIKDNLFRKIENFNYETINSRFIP